MDRKHMKNELVWLVFESRIQVLPLNQHGVD